MACPLRQADRKNAGVAGWISAFTGAPEVRQEYRGLQFLANCGINAKRQLANAEASN